MPGSADIEALDRAFLRIRRAMVKPITSAVPLPSLGRTCDLAKVLACETIAALSGESGDTGEGTAAAGESPTVKDVATALHLDHSTTSRLLGEAEAEGLVVRGSDPADRRLTRVALTDVGRALVADSGVVRRWILAETFAGWDQADVSTLAHLMERVAETFDERAGEVKERAFERFGLPGTQSA